jgi:hypothetical protein
MPLAAAALAAKTAEGKQMAAEGALRPNITNLRKELRKAFGGSAAGILAPARSEARERGPIPGLPLGAENAPRFGLTLPPEAIEIG